MRIQKEFLRRGGVILLLILAGGSAYLPNIANFGYFNDDWYLMYSANAIGPGAFEGIYSIDRPARATVMGIAYSLFGMNPLYYNLSAFLFRVLGAYAFLWALRRLWPGRSSATATMALLFLIYPGFLSTPNAIDYQSQQISLFFALVSIALSIQAILDSRPFVKVILWILATFTAITYLSLVEYFLGLEFLRFGMIFILVMRDSGTKRWQGLGKVFYRYVLFLAGPLTFIIWRFFIFESERRATDIGVQISQLTGSPFLTLVSWSITLLKDSFEIIFMSWGVPLSIVWDIPLRFREMFLAGTLVSGAVLISILTLRSELQFEREGETAGWIKDAVWLGLASVLASLIPVVISNREANFYYFSRYMLAGAAGTAIFVTAIIYQLNTRMAREAGISILIISAVITHHLNGVSAARTTEAMQNFWWQVSWRIPQLRPETTLVANYSHASIEEDYFVWGPANLIYYPQSSSPDSLRPVISSAVLTRDFRFSILNQEAPRRVVRRSITTYVDYENILILTQPFGGTCVQVIDGSLPVVSAYEQYDVSLVARSSNPENILLNGMVKIPPEIVFGPEPDHGWCYYYEVASLAYQQGNWDEVVTLGKEARKNGFSAVDPVEWMPFMQAAAIMGDQQEIVELSKRVRNDPFLADQACTVLSGMPELNTEMKAFVTQTFCE